MENDTDDNVFRGLVIALPFGVVFWSVVVWLVFRG